MVRLPTVIFSSSFLWLSHYISPPLADKSRASHDRFVNPNNFPFQLQRVKESNDLKYLQTVSITSEPAVMQAFKNNGGANIYVLQNCATSECHAATRRESAA